MAEYPHNGLIPLPYHHLMLTDEARMQAFSQAIERTVTADDVVLEVGGGTGVLSMLAARKARRVYTVEYSPANAAACERFVRINGLSDRIQVILADARQWVPPEPVQVVICEMLHVGLINEQQVPVLNHLHRQLGDFKAIPMGVVSAVEPVAVDFREWGFELPFIRYQAYGQDEPKIRPLSVAPQVYWQADFFGLVEEEVSATVPFSFDRTGIWNAVRFTSVAVVDAFPDDQGQTNNWGLRHLIVPLETPLAVQAGVRLDLNLRYRAGCELQELQFDVLN